MPTASMGYEGENVWLMNEGKTYEGNAAVYHTLRFYFYAMPEGNRGGIILFSFCKLYLYHYKN